MPAFKDFKEAGASYSRQIAYLMAGDFTSFYKEVDNPTSVYDGQSFCLAWGSTGWNPRSLFANVPGVGTCNCLVEAKHYGMGDNPVVQKLGLMDNDLIPEWIKDNTPCPSRKVLREFRRLQLKARYPEQFTD